LDLLGLVVADLWFKFHFNLLRFESEYFSIKDSASLLLSSGLALESGKQALARRARNAAEGGGAAGRRGPGQAAQLGCARAAHEGTRAGVGS
jgi:hypothetical protein